MHYAQNAYSRISTVRGAPRQFVVNVTKAASNYHKIRKAKIVNIRTITYTVRFDAVVKGIIVIEH